MIHSIIEKHTGKGNDTHTGKYLLDVSHRSVVTLKGKDGLDLLQRLSTNEVAKLETGKSVQTILTSEKGKIVDVIVVLKLSDDHLLLIGNTTGGEVLRAWLDKYIIMEEASVENKSDDFAHFLLYGQGAVSNIKSGGQENIYALPERLGKVTLHHLLFPLSEKSSMLSRLAEAGFQPTEEAHFSEFRVENAIPAYPNELSADYNPVEAGLVDLISFTKGCYIGQEVIARLDTYKKVQKHLVRFSLGARPEAVPIPISNSKEEVGSITTLGTVVEDSGLCKALGYLKTNVDDTNPLFILKDGQSIPVKTIA